MIIILLSTWLSNDRKPFSPFQSARSATDTDNTTSIVEKIKKILSRNQGGSTGSSVIA